MMKEKKNIGALFDGIAKTYDRFNHITSLGIDIWWRRVAIRHLRPVNHLLDVAIGTADLAITAVSQHKAQHVTGLDLSEEMMRIGAQKVRREGMEGHIVFQQGSALEMPYHDGSFDAVTCAYGIRNFSDLDQGLREMRRVLKPGGQLVILEFSYPRNRVVRRCYDLYFTHLMPLLGRLISHDAGAYTYFLHSVKQFIWGEEMLAHLRQAGFARARFRTLTFGITTLYTATIDE